MGYSLAVKGRAWDADDKVRAGQSFFRLLRVKAVGVPGANMQERTGVWKSDGDSSNP